MSEPSIKTEAVLFTALMDWMKRTGPQRTYPAAVVAFSEFVLNHLQAHDTLTNVDVIEAFGTLDNACPCCGSGEQSALGTLFHNLAGAPKNKLYSASVVELTAKVIELLQPADQTTRSQMIFDAVELLPNGHAWFAVQRMGRRRTLVTTPQGAAALDFRVSLRLPKLLHQVIQPE